MNILAVDDEQFALENLVEAIEIVQPHAKIFSFTNPTKALDFYKEQPCDIAFIDIEMGVMNGLDFAKRLKVIHPLVNLIFVTGYLDYSLDAFELRASGYLIKPITSEKIKEELENLRHPIQHQTKKHILVHTFGNFEIYLDNKPLNFKYEKTKELVAYLVDRKGAYCSNGEIMAILWEGKKRSSYFSNLRKDLLDTLKENHCEDMIDAAWGKLRLNKDVVSCDYYDWLKGKTYAINSYHGEYMKQYSWAEFTNASLY